jgi:hypothetical protein
MSNLAPIVLFVYNRPDHTQETVEALSYNTLASESELFIYSDAPKNETAIEKVSEVRRFIKTICGFKSVTIIEQDKNWGLAASIIDGVTTVINQYGKTIVLEDDIVTSPFFLKFMNDALDFYQSESKVWSISGYNYPISNEGLPSYYFLRSTSSWGWATWKDRWGYFEKIPQNLMNIFSKEDIFHFNINGSINLWGQIIDNYNDKIDTWAIFWYAVVFQNNGLVLYPAQSFVENIGFDGSGEHCGKNSSFSHDFLTRESLFSFSEIKLEENKLALKRVIKYFKKQKSILTRIRNKVRVLTEKYFNGE